MRAPGSCSRKVKQKGLSKKGDRYLRSLLVNGAMAVVRQAQKRPDKHPWVAKLFGRMSAKQAASAIANKTARIARVLRVRGGVYEAGHRAPGEFSLGSWAGHGMDALGRVS
jgi:transposase